MNSTAKRRTAREFRSLQAAAPLKPCIILLSTRLVNTIPQPAGCGPIEAPLASVPCTETLIIPQPAGCGPIEARLGSLIFLSRVTIPQPAGCGPIEAQSRRHHLKHSHGIPQPAGCGPIEARSCITRGGSSPEFRSLQAAAPLKRNRRRGRRQIRQRQFRSLQAAAPLKLRTSASARTISCKFRSLQAAAPLKRRLVFRLESRITNSAACRLRPH